MQTLDISCPNCGGQTWKDNSRSLNQIERQSGCNSLWACENCGHEVVKHQEEFEKPREEFDPLEYVG